MICHLCVGALVRDGSVAVLHVGAVLAVIVPRGLVLADGTGAAGSRSLPTPHLRVEYMYSTSEGIHVEL